MRNKLLGLQEYDIPSSISPRPSHMQEKNLDIFLKNYWQDYNI